VHGPWPLTTITLNLNHLNALVEFSLNISITFELFLDEELVDVPPMLFSSLLCCSPANVKKTHSETDPPTPSKPLPPVVSLLNLCFKPSLLMVTRQESPTVPRITNFVLPEAPAKRTASSIKSANLEVYTAQRALDLFNSYVDEDVPDVIGPEGFEKLCTDASMPMEGARPLIFAWQLQVEEMGKISKQEWVQGMATLRSVFCCAVRP